MSRLDSELLELDDPVVELLVDVEFAVLPLVFDELSTPRTRSPVSVWWRTVAARIRAAPPPVDIRKFAIGVLAASIVFAVFVPVFDVCARLAAARTSDAPIPIKIRAMMLQPFQNAERSVSLLHVHHYTLIGKLGRERRTGLLLLLLAFLGGCEKDDAAPPNAQIAPAGSIVVVIGPYAHHEQWIGIRGGARRAAANTSHLRVEFLAPEDDSSEAQQKTIAAAMAREPAAICWYPPDRGVPDEVVKSVEQSPAKLIVAGADVKRYDAFARVVINWPAGAELLGANLAAIVQPQRSYLLLHENTAPAPRANAERMPARCYERFMSAARKQHQVTLLQEEDATGRTASDLVRDMFARFRSATLVVTVSPAPWLSQRPPFSLEPGQRFATLSAAPALWQRLRSGEAAALVGPLDGEIGYAMMELAMRALSGERPPESPRTIECELVTAATLDDFVRRYAVAAGVDPNSIAPRAPATQAIGTP